MGLDCFQYHLRDMTNSIDKYRKYLLMAKIFPPRVNTDVPHLTRGYRSTYLSDLTRRLGDTA